MCFEQEGNVVFADANNPDYDGDCHAEGHWPPWGIEEVSGEVSRIFVSPNPVCNVSSIALENKQAEEITIKIYSIDGSLIKEESVNSIEGFKIYKNEFVQGIYFIKAIIESNIYTTKFIVN